MNELNEAVKCENSILLKENNELVNAIYTLKRTYVGLNLDTIKKYGDEFIVNMKGSRINIEALVDQQGIIKSISYIKNSDEIYSSNARKAIIKKTLPQEKEYFYEDSSGLAFSINIYSSCAIVNSSNVIHELLNEQHPINNVLDIYYAIKDCLDCHDISINIKSEDEQSFLLTQCDVIVAYQSIQKKDEYHETKEYLENGKLYFETRERREIKNNSLKLIKK